MVPVANGIPGGAERFLEDLWRVAPRRVAFGSTVAVLAIAISPPLTLRRWAAFHQLSADERDAAVRILLGFRFYPLRLMVTAVKMQALVAVLRDDDCRRALGLAL
jgi:hypothetical protein